MSFAASGFYFLIGDSLQTVRGSRNATWATARRRLYVEAKGGINAKTFMTMDDGSLASGTRAPIRRDSFGVAKEGNLSFSADKEGVRRMMIALLGNDPVTGRIDPNIYGGELTPPLMDCGWKSGRGYNESGFWIYDFSLSWKQDGGKVEGSITTAHEIPVTGIEPGTLPAFTSTNFLETSNIGISGVPGGCNLLSFDLKISQGVKYRKCIGEGQGFATSSEYGDDLTASISVTISEDAYDPDPVILANGKVTGVEVDLDGLVIHLGPCSITAGELGEDGQLLTNSFTLEAVDDTAGGAPIVWVTGAGVVG